MRSWRRRRATGQPIQPRDRSTARSHWPWAASARVRSGVGSNVASTCHAADTASVELHTPVARPLVGLQLQHEVHRRRATVDAELGEVGAAGDGHGVDDVAGLVHHRLHHRACQVGSRGAAGDAEDGAARIRVPPGRAEPGEGRHDHDATAVGHRRGERAGLGSRVDDAETVAQPLHGRTGDEDRALERVRDAAVGQLPRHRGEQALRRRGAPIAHVHEHEAAGAVGVLRHAGREARLAEQGGLLVAGHAAHGDAGRHAARRAGGADHAAARHDRGQRVDGHPEQRAQVGVPLAGADVAQHRAAGVGDVGGEAAAVGAAREVPHDPRIDRAEGQAGVGRDTALGEQPLGLGAREVRVEHQPGALADEIEGAVGGEPVAPLGRAAVLPHDGPTVRSAGAPVPGDDRLALVGDADRRHGAGTADGVDDLAERGDDGAPDLVGVVLDPAGLRVVLAELLVGRGDRAAAVVDRTAAHPGGAGVDGDDDAHRRGPPGRPDVPPVRLVGGGLGRPDGAVVAADEAPADAGRCSRARW